MEEANSETKNIVTVVQGDHSFKVSKSDVLQYPNSFLAGCLSSEKRGSLKRNKNGAIIVQDRNTDYFPFVEQFYKQKKVKLPSPSVDLKSVEGEFAFWFTDTPVAISYKDPVVDLAYSRKLYIDKLFAEESPMIETQTRERANQGFQSWDKKLNKFVPVKAAVEYCKVYQSLVAELYPSDKFMVTSRCSELNLLGISIAWELGGGQLGALSQQALKSMSKTLLTQLLTKAKEQCLHGSVTIAPEVLRFPTAIPPNFIDYFRKYVQKKSVYKNLEFTFVDRSVTMDFGGLGKVEFSK